MHFKLMIIIIIHDYINIVALIFIHDNNNNKSLCSTICGLAGLGDFLPQQVMSQGDTAIGILYISTFILCSITIMTNDNMTFMNYFYSSRLWFLGLVELRRCSCMSYVVCNRCRNFYMCHLSYWPFSQVCIMRLGRGCC